jgi:ABC-type amino acid transport substrate-binding protein
LAEQHWPGKLQFLAGAEADQFPICAAVRPNEGDLKDAIDQALDELARSGRLANVFARWHIPYTAPPREEKPK